VKSCDEPIPGVSLGTMTQFTVELDRETDGRWIAEIPALPGAMCYGSSKEEASRKVEALALRILADRIENGDEVPELAGAFLSIPA
jgi:predicted RNase H-like HicB family nuclease